MKLRKFRTGNGSVIEYAPEFKMSTPFKVLSCPLSKEDEDYLKSGEYVNLYREDATVDLSLSIGGAFKKLGMSRLIMASLMMLASGIMNITPWGGPTARAASALQVDPSHVFVPMIIPMLFAISWLFVLAYMY